MLTRRRDSTIGNARAGIAFPFRPLRARWSHAHERLSEARRRGLPESICQRVARLAQNLSVCAARWELIWEGTVAILGVNGATNELWLAVVSDDGEVLDAQVRIQPASDSPLGTQVSTALDEAGRIIVTNGITAAVILEPETGQFQPSYSASVLRISLETAVVMAAHRAGVPVVRRSRKWVRTKLDLPNRGKLSELARDVVEAHPPHWTGKRDLAALAALAERLA